MSGLPRFPRRFFASTEAFLWRWRKGVSAIGVCLWLTLGAGAGAQDGNAPVGEATATPTPGGEAGESETSDGKDADLLTLEGVRAFGQKDLVVAREKFQQALEKNPDHVIALVNLGSLEYHSGRLEEAQKRWSGRHGFPRDPSPRG